MHATHLLSAALFSLSDSALAEMVCDSKATRVFVRINQGREPAPDQDNGELKWKSALSSSA